MKRTYGPLRLLWSLGTRSLRARLIGLFFVFSLAPLAISNVIGYQQSRAYLTEQALSNVRNVATLEAAETYISLRAKLDLLPSIVAGNQHLFGLLDSVLTPASPEHKERATEALQKHLRAKAREAGADEMLVVSAGGAVIASSDAGSDGAATLCNTRVRVAPQVAGFEYPDAEPRLVVTNPIRDGADRFLGTLCGRFRFDVHHEMERVMPAGPAHGFLYLLDAQGRVVCSSFHDARQGPIGQHFDLEALGGGQQVWHGHYRLDSGDQALAALAPVPSIGWGVLMAVPIEHALASLHQLKRRAFALAGLFAVVLIGVALVTADRLVRPLKTVVAASRRMASGARGVSVAVDGPEELGELGRAFNLMSTALKGSEDLLEQRVAERTHELKQAREFAELLLDSFEQSVVVIDRDLRITRANQAAAKLFSRELVGEDCAVLCSGREGPCDECAVRDTFTQARAAYAERSQQVGIGQEILRIESFPVLDADGRVDAVVQIGRIVTAERRLQAQMIHQEKMAAFGLLAAGIAHEIGNPLAAIMSQLRSARSETPADEGHETLRIVEQQVERISRLLRELVNLARRRPADVTLVDLNQVVADVGRLLVHDPRARNIHIEQSLKPHLPGVQAKEDELVQVMLNLGLNALDAMPEGGSLVFETAALGSMVLVRVRDTGRGISQDAQLRMFEPFFTTKMPGRGTGLGLFVSKGIVEALGGRLMVESTGVGGTIFAVHLPSRDGSRRAEVA